MNQSNNAPGWWRERASKGARHALVSHVSCTLDPRQHRFLQFQPTAPLHNVYGLPLEQPHASVGSLKTQDAFSVPTTGDYLISVVLVRDREIESGASVALQFELPSHHDCNSKADAQPLLFELPHGPIHIQGISFALISPVTLVNSL